MGYIPIKLEHPFRIGICGAHGVGKTTLAKKICEHVPNTIYLPEIARELIEAVGWNWKEAFVSEEVLYFQRSIWNSYLFFNAVCRRRKLNAVSDRTLFDVMAYTFYHCLKYRNVYETLFDEMWEWMTGIDNYYDCVLFYLVNPKDADRYQLFIQSTISLLLDEFEVQFRAIRRGDILQINGVDITV